MKNHETSPEHCYLGCHWGYEMLCQEIGCQKGVVHQVPKPAPKPEPIVLWKKAAPKPGSSATGATGSATGGDGDEGGDEATGGVNSITGGTSDDDAGHLRSVEGVNNGWASDATGTDDEESSTGAATGAATGSATGADDDESSTGAATGSSTGGAEVATEEEIKEAKERRRLR